MAYKIIWNSEADADFKSIIIYLKTSGLILLVKNLQTIRKLEKLTSVPYVPGFTSKPNIQIVKWDRKNVLFFSVEIDIMILLSIYPYNKRYYQQIFLTKQVH